MSAASRAPSVLMATAVEASVGHVESGGLPFVGVVITTDGWVSDPGVNLVRETGDPSAHAEIVAMRQTIQVRGRDSLREATLLATGEPCAPCYRFAASHQVGAVRYAVDRDTAARWGFDYRAGYQHLGTDQLAFSRGSRHLPVAQGLRPFTTYLQHHFCDTTT